VEGTVASFNVSGLTSDEISEYQIAYFDNGSGSKQTYPIS
jgi:hypothetical protein